MPKLPVAHETILKIQPYVPGRSNAKGKNKTIKLSSNENPFGASKAAQKALKQSAKKLHRYPDGGATQLREALGQAFNLNPQQIICGAGSDELIAFITNAFASPGSEIIYSEHGFLMYPIAAQRVGAKPVKVKEKNLKTDGKAIVKAVTKKTRIVFLANPNNPTGSYISKKELHELRKKLPASVLLVIDDAYAEYVTAGDYSDGIELAKSTENTIVLHTFSKIYGLPAARLGWGYAAPDIIEMLHRVRSPFNVSTQAQMAGVAALADKKHIEKSRVHNAKWREKMMEEFKRIGLKPYPSQGNFILVEFPKKEGRTAKEADAYLLKASIIGRRMEAYGLPSCLRFTIGTKHENRALLKALTRFMN